MSASLLQKIKGHIIDDGGLLTGYAVRYYKWFDDDLNGSGQVAMFRMTGSNGDIGHEVQFPDVSLFLLSSPHSVKSSDDDMLEVLRYLRSDFSTVGVFNMYPVGTYSGPMSLQNGRDMFEMVIRVGTEDH